MERGMRRRRSGEIEKKEGESMREGRCRAEVGVDHSFRAGWREEGKAMSNFKGPGRPRQREGLEFCNPKRG